MAEVMPPTRRRWFRFRLGTMLMLVTMMAVSAFGVRECIERERLQSRLIVLEAELEGRQDVKLRKLEEQLNDLELAIAEARRIKGNNNPAMRRFVKSKDAVEAKIALRRDELLKRSSQRTP
jgi:hypothetical protein